MAEQKDVKPTGWVINKVHKLPELWIGIGKSGCGKSNIEPNLRAARELGIDLAFPGEINIGDFVDVRDWLKARQKNI